MMLYGRHRRGADLALMLLGGAPVNADVARAAIDHNRRQQRMLVVSSLSEAHHAVLHPDRPMTDLERRRARLAQHSAA